VFRLCPASPGAQAVSSGLLAMIALLTVAAMLTVVANG
jgi:hypothetical protein